MFNPNGKDGETDRSMVPLARFFLFLGSIFLLIGGVLYLLARFNIPLGRLPGDIRIEGQNFRFYFPLATSLLLSLVLTVVLNLLARWWKK